MPALRQQERRATLVRLFRHHVEKERLTRSSLASQEGSHGLLQAFHSSLV